MKHICVFCTSWDPYPAIYKEATIDLAERIAKKGYVLVYGGSDVGLMSVLAKTAQRNKGKVVGIIPEIFSDLQAQDDEIIKAKDFGERKALMILRSDAFICMPGGYGTLDEMSDVIVGKQIGAHNKPIVIVNINGFYNHLLAHFERMFGENFANKDEHLYALVETPAQAMHYLENYRPTQAPHSSSKG